MNADLSINSIDRSALNRWADPDPLAGNAFSRKKNTRGKSPELSTRVEISRQVTIPLMKTQSAEQSENNNFPHTRKIVLKTALIDKMTKLISRNVSKAPPSKIRGEVKKCKHRIQDLNVWMGSAKGSPLLKRDREFIEEFIVHCRTLIVIGTEQKNDLKLFEEVKVLEIEIEKFEKLPIQPLGYYSTLTDSECEMVIKQCMNGNPLNAQDCKNLMDLFLDDGKLRSLNKWILQNEELIRSHSAAGDTIKFLKAFSFFAVRLPDWKMQLHNLERKIGHLSDDPLSRQLTADECWILDHFPLIKDAGESLAKAINRHCDIEGTALCYFTGKNLDKAKIQAIKQHLFKNNKPGDIFLWDIRREEAYRGKRDQMSYKIWDLYHRAQMHITGCATGHLDLFGGLDTEGHPFKMGSYLNAVSVIPMSVGDSYYCSSYRLDTQKLLSDEALGALDAMCHSMNLAETFKRLCFTKENIDAFQRLRNPEDKRQFIIDEAQKKIASSTYLANQYGESVIFDNRGNSVFRQVLSLFRPETTLFGQGFENPARKVPSEVICSEFAAIMIHNNLIMLKEKLLIIFNAAGIQLKNKDFVTFLFAPDTNFAAIHTGKITELFQSWINAGIMRRVPPPTHFLNDNFYGPLETVPIF